MLVVLVPVGTPSSAEWHWDREEEVLSGEWRTDNHEEQ